MRCAIGLAFALLLSAAAVAQEKKGEPKPPADQFAIADRLLERTTFDAVDKMTAREFVEWFEKRFDVTLLIDVQSFTPSQPVAMQDAAFLDQPVSFPRMRNVRIDTILKRFTDQIHGVALIYADRIEIVPPAKAYALTRPGNLRIDDTPLADEQLISLVQLVTVSFNQKPLKEVLQDLGDRTGCTIVLANQVVDAANTKVTARFNNTPVETAVATLAEMAELKLARKGNVLLVTTAERAAAFAPPTLPANSD